MGSNTSSRDTVGNESKVSYERLSLFFLQELAKNNKKRKIQKYNRFIYIELFGFNYDSFNNLVIKLLILSADGLGAFVLIRFPLRSKII